MRIKISQGLFSCQFLMRSWLVKYAKFLAVAAGCLLSLLRLLALTGGPTSAAGMSVDTSWFIGMITTARQGAMLGRDITFNYGPVAQGLAQLGAGFNTAGSAIDGYGLALLAFRCLGVLSIGLALVLIKPLDWKFSVFILAACTTLNLVLFTEFNRSWLAVLGALVLWRGVSATTAPWRIGWGGGLGLLAVLGQLYTLETGLYFVLAALLALGLFSIVARFQPQLLPGCPPYWHFLGMLGAVLGSFILGNLSVSLYFLASSPDYKNLLDYQWRSLELMRGYNYTMGTPWEFAWTSTLVIAIMLAYCSLFLIRNLARLLLTEIYLLVSLLAFAVVQLKSATVRSGSEHIIQAATPLVFLFLVLGHDWRRQGRLKAGWVVLLMLLLATWPNASFAAFQDLNAVFSGNVSITNKLKQSASQNTPAENFVAAGLIKATGPASALLIFPYQNHLASALNKPLVAPVLQAFIAHSVALQQNYIDELDRQKSGLQVIYGIDYLASSPIDKVQQVTRLPVIFEYLYRNFQALSTEVYPPGYMLLQPRAQPASLDAAPLNFRTSQPALPHSFYTIDAAATCSLVRLTTRLDYPFYSLLGRPASFNLKFWLGDKVSQSAEMLAIGPGQTISVYVQLLEPANFSQIFSTGPVQTREWDRLEITQNDYGLFNIGATSLELKKIECVTFPR